MKISECVWLGVLQIDLDGSVFRTERLRPRLRRYVNHALYDTIRIIVDCCSHGMLSLRDIKENSIKRIGHYEAGGCARRVSLVNASDRDDVR